MTRWGSGSHPESFLENYFRRILAATQLRNEDAGCSKGDMLEYMPNVSAVPSMHWHNCNPQELRLERVRTNVSGSDHDCGYSRTIEGALWTRSHTTRISRSLANMGELQMTPRIQFTTD